MKTIILAGGFATRLRPLTLTKPKPLLPILDKPLLDWIINSLTNSGLRDVIISVKYLADAIKNFCNNKNYGAEISFAEEPRPLGDAGPLRLISKNYELNSTFLVVYGDIFSNVDYGKVVDFHRKHSGLATMVVTKVEDPSKYGVVVLEDSGRVIRFVEKPPKGEVLSNIVNAGIYVFEPEIIKYIPETPSKLAKEVLPKLVDEGVLYAYVHEGIWSDIGQPSDYLKANFDALRHYYPNGYISSESVVDSAEIIQPSYISSNVRLGNLCKIGPYTIIGKNSVIGPAVRIRNSLLFNNVVVDEGAVISYSLIGEKSLIGKWVRVEPESVIGDEVVIRDEILIPKKTVILPYKDVDLSVNNEGSIIL